MSDAREWSRGDTARYFRAGTREDDKYSRGVVGLRTGSPAYPGAAVLGVEAAWRSGAGFVRFAGAQRVVDAVLARRPETVGGPDTGRTRIDAWVIGSGTDPADRSEDEARALREILSGAAPVVIDAGALDLAPGARAPFVVTPHAGEFARLRERLRIGPDDGEPTDDVRQVAAKLGGTVLRKGARTLIAAPGGEVLAVDAGTGWLATAGTGDVLAGVLGAVIAANPGAPLAEAAASAAWIHGHAARIAAGVRDGVPGHPIVALDVAEALPSAIADVLS
ncbi:ADP/ATP-dependent (S)-NAD(P)H-hydrate dehydratase [Microbacterium sp. p3-SID336]|uniref:ADP-dependent NAD(P)H-hydrate dehydratase n=1 Tax=Microbacterium sp. p3-SID336 TaxID=2916212 RepID=UPI0021A38D52|nr:ADP/ATP-dependent (S)-NAD(P)H-hydrate dehydratase [Microbacterium sp. p3-SID336]MCT1480033.1 NAD(P)H-hydrate dehydratase [Microbacterium sp. p3-SID336]